MEFIDLKAQYRLLAGTIQDRMQKVIENGHFILGPEVFELEAKLAEYVGVEHCVSCANGTDALQMALMAKGIGPGDAVFTSPFTFIATSEVIALLGATPVFVDIDPLTYNLDPVKLAEAVISLKQGRRPSPGSPLGLHPKAVIPVDLFGLPADYGAIKKIADAEGLFVLEDAAQSFGGTSPFGKAGILGDVAATSFFPAKPLGCYGDGGALLTNDAILADLLRSIRMHGKGEDKYENVRTGINSRLDTLQAAVLLAKLEIFPDELELRRKIATRYSEGLKGVVETPIIPEGYASAWAQYSVRSPYRPQLIAALKQEGIPTMVYYPKPLHLQKANLALGYLTGSFPISERVATEIFSLPMHPYLSEGDQSQIIMAVRKYVKLSNSKGANH